MSRKGRTTKSLLSGGMVMGVGELDITSFDLKDYYDDLEPERKRIDKADVTEKGIARTSFTTSEFFSIAEQKMDKLFKELEKQSPEERTACIEHMMMRIKHKLDTEVEKTQHIPVSDIFERISPYSKKKSSSSLCLLDKYQLQIVNGSLDIWESYKTTLMSMKNNDKIWTDMSLENLLKWINNAIIAMKNICVYIVNEPPISETAEGFYVDDFYKRWVEEREKTEGVKSEYDLDMFLFWPLHDSHRFYQGIQLEVKITKFTEEERSTLSRKLMFQDQIKFLSSEILTTCKCKPEILLREKRGTI